MVQTRSRGETSQGLVSHQVLQRDHHAQNASVIVGDTTRTLPVGGPYTISDDGGAVVAADVLVGDLWILAGQSNMAGTDVRTEPEEPSPAVHMLDIGRRWRPDVEPPGLGLTFGRTYHDTTGVPVGLVATAVSGSALAQWSPQPVRDGDGVLYAALLDALSVAGGRVAGVLWYQGESEACNGVPEDYQEQLASLQQALRRDTGDAELPILHVQLGRHISDQGAAGDRRWSRMREEQRRAKASGMVSAVDLDLDDYIHISTPSLRRLGRRLARLVTGAATAITLRSLRVDSDRLGIVVAYDGVNGRLTPDTHVAGFSLHLTDGEARPAIVHSGVTPEGDAVHIRLARPLDSYDHLAYGYGMDPHVSLRDTADMSAPAFGPLTLLGDN